MTNINGMISTIQRPEPKSMANTINYANEAPTENSCYLLLMRSLWNQWETACQTSHLLANMFNLLPYLDNKQIYIHIKRNKQHWWYVFNCMFMLTSGGVPYMNNSKQKNLQMREKWKNKYQRTSLAIEIYRRY